MNPKFCPKCGAEEKRGNLLIEGLCKKCFLKENPVLLEFKEFKTTICISCSSYMHQNKWYPILDNDPIKNIKKIITFLIKEKLKFNQKIKVTKIEVNPLIPKEFQIKQKLITINTELKIQGLLFNKKIKETYKIPIKINFSICNLCSKKTSNYYEAILQIRPKSQELLDFIKNDIKITKRAFITKEEALKNGYNLYLTSQSYAKTLLTLLKTKFNIETKSSYTLFGRKDGKDIYRATILVKLK